MKVRRRVTVPSAAKMDNDTLLKHIEKRHANDYRVERTPIPRYALSAWIKPWRTYHDRLHAIAVPGQYDHDHEED